VSGWLFGVISSPLIIVFSTNLHLSRRLIFLISAFLIKKGIIGVAFNNSKKRAKIKTSLARGYE